MPELSPAQHEVLLGLSSYRDEYRPYVRTIAADCALPVETVRQILRYFDHLGWVTHGPVFNPDTGLAQGSTWWLTVAGLAERARRAAQLNCARRPISIDKDLT